MATQMQPTPILYGKDARDVLEDIKKKPTEEHKRRDREWRKLFAQMQKKGLD